MPEAWVKDLPVHIPKEKRGKYDQYGESVILARIFENIGTTNKFCVDFGAGDGYRLSNTRHLIEEGWDALLMEGAPERDYGREYSPDVKFEFVTRENINSLFEKYDVPKSFDLLSVDIDGNDLWVWKAIEYDPRVVVIEYNGCIPPGLSITIPYDANFVHHKDDYYGASFDALKKLGKEKGYVLIHQLTETNLFFVKEELMQEIEYGVTHRANQYHPPHPKTENHIWVEY